MNNPKSSKPRRIVTAPPASQPGLPSLVLTVECSEDQEVQWLWTETPQGRYVSGYRLVPLARPPDVTSE